VCVCVRAREQACQRQEHTCLGYPILRTTLPRSRDDALKASIELPDVSATKISCASVESDVLVDNKKGVIVSAKVRMGVGMRMCMRELGPCQKDASFSVFVVCRCACMREG